MQIDELVVGLTLDTKGFQKGQKQTGADLDKLRKQTESDAKRMEEAGKRAAGFFGEVATTALKLSSILLGGIGLTEFAAKTFTADAAAGRLASSLGISVTELSRWRMAAQLAGGSAESMDAAFRMVNDSLQKYKFTNVAEGPLQAFKNLDISLDDAKGNVRSVTDLMMDLSRAISTQKNPQEAMGLAKLLGLDENTSNLLKGGEAGVNKFLAEADKIGPATDENAAAAARLTHEWVTMQLSAESLGRSLLNDLSPALEVVLKQLTGTFDGSGNIISNAANSVANFLAGTKNETIGGSLYELFHPGGATASPSTSVSSQGASSSATSPVNLPRNIRNNNPGNLEYNDWSKKMGATGSDGRFAIFPTMQAGIAASQVNLRGYLGRGYNTISKIISHWSPPKENGAANTNAYIADVASRTGIDPNVKVTSGQLTSISEAMYAHEGGSRYAKNMLTGINGSGQASGGNSSQVNIGTLNVNTKATDANGIAKGMKGAISTNGLVAQANSATSP